MSIRKFIRAISPPVFCNADKKLAGRVCSPIWEGIYKHYEDVPTSGEGFESDYWVGLARARAEKALAASQAGGAIPSGLTSDYSLLPFMVSLLGAQQEKITVLDFGGGVGISYIHTMSSRVGKYALEFHIVESEKVCAAGRQLFAQDNQIRFHTALPDNLKSADIIYMRSSLQYVADYKELLSGLARFAPRYFLYAHLSAGGFPTYATSQGNVTGSAIAYWFINIDEIVELMKSSGYALAFKVASDAEYDQSNFPPTHRMGRPCNLLFARK